MNIKNKRADYTIMFFFFLTVKLVKSWLYSHFPFFFLIYWHKKQLQCSLFEKQFFFFFRESESNKNKEEINTSDRF